MTKLQTVLLAILSALVAGLLYKFVPSMSTVATGLAGLSLVLLGWAKQHPEDAKALEAASAVDLPVDAAKTVPIRPVQGGFGTLGTMLLVLALAAVGVLATARVCRAQTPTPVSPQLGGCVASGAVCFGTAADVVLTKIGLSSDNKGISGGFSTGVGYGVTAYPDRFYATGLDLFLNVNLSGAAGVASRVSPALMLHAMNYLFVGLSMDITAPTTTTDSYGTGWSMLLGFGSTITSITPGYAKGEAARQLAAERASAGAK